MSTGQDGFNSDDPRDAAERRRTVQAQEAHGGSMAPGLVDAVGRPVTDAPESLDDDAR